MIKNRNNRKSEYLPNKIIKELNEFLSTYTDYRSRNNFIRCIGIIFNHQIGSESDYDGYVPLGSAYWRKVFSHDYHQKVLNPLLELGIIQCKDMGFRNISSPQYRGIVSKRYRLNPELISDDCEFMDYFGKGKVWTSESLDEFGEEYDVLPANDRNFKISILKDKAITYISEEMENICRSLLKPEYVQNFPNNYPITYFENTNGVFITKYGNISSATKLAQLLGKQLFYYNKDFYLADIEEFLCKKIESTSEHYLIEISKAGNYPVLNKRSKTNLRLHNYLTNFPSRLLHFLRLNNQGLVQFDLQTSQFLLFANLLNIYLWHGEEFLLKLFKHRLNQQYLKRLIKVFKKYQLRLPSCGVDISDTSSCMYCEHDVLEFIRDVFFDDFYEVVKTKLNLPERSVAKQTMFKMLFKPNTKSDVFIEVLKQHYPTVIQIIDDFKTSDKVKVNQQKKENPKSEKKDLQSNFSVFLQCIEAEIYVDNIYLPLREQLIPCFTRHDSVVVALEYQDWVEAHIKSVFAGFGFRYNQSYSDMSVAAYSQEELEKNGYNDYLADRSDEIDFEVYEDSYTKPINSFDDDVLDNDYDEVIEWEDVDPEIIEKLIELGISDDYSDSVDDDLLQDLLQLPLTTDQATALEVELENLRQGMSCFQDETNEVIREVIRKFI